MGESVAYWPVCVPGKYYPLFLCITCNFLSWILDTASPRTDFADPLVNISQSSCLVKYNSIISCIELSML